VAWSLHTHCGYSYLVQVLGAVE